jgi:cytochrome c
MPQFSDLSDAQLHDIARYIHYARQEGRYKELVDAPPAHGDAASGKTYFDAHCSKCHSSNLTGIGKRDDSAALLRDMLRPKALTGPTSFTLDAMADTTKAAARQAHNTLLENYTPADVGGLVAYLATR